MAITLKWCLLVPLQAENGKQNEKGAAKADHAAAEAKNEKGHEEGHDKGHGKGMGNWHEFGGEILSKCQEEEHASKEDIESIKVCIYWKKLPKNSELKCLYWLHLIVALLQVLYSIN